MHQNTADPLRRHLVISYLPSLANLNGSPVRAGEREDAERAFIRYYVDMEVKPARSARYQ